LKISGRSLCQAGVLEALGDVVKEFLAADDKKSVVTKAEEIASTLTGSDARFVYADC
jgi:hypothetical protein